MKIDIWSDFNCPFCYIGETSLYTALKSLQSSVKVEIIHHCFQLDPFAPKQNPSPTVDILASKYGLTKAEAQQSIDSVVRKAASIGLTYHFDKVVATHTLLAHRFAKAIEQQTQSTEVYTRLYDAYFTQGKNLNDESTLVALGQDLGVDEKFVRDVLESSAYLKECLEDQQKAQSLNIQGVPHFVINGKRSIHGAQPLALFEETLKLMALDEIKKQNRD